jgi:hypothetical protein
VPPTPPAFVLGDPDRRTDRGIDPSARWGGRQELRADLRVSAQLTSALALCGLPVGLLWEALAPRADFRVTADGPVPVGDPSVELSVAIDSVLVLLLVGLGVLSGALAWRLRRGRGVAVVLALAVGAALAALVAWQLGELLGAGPTEADLERVGAVVTTPVRLSALAALSAAPFSAVLAYVVGALATRSDDLGRPGPPPGAAGRELEAAEPRPAGEESVDAGARG